MARILLADRERACNDVGDPDRLGQAYERAGASVSFHGDVLHVSGITAEDAGDIALAVQVPVYQLVTEGQNLEEVFMSLADNA